MKFKILKTRKTFTYYPSSVLRCARQCDIAIIFGLTKVIPIFIKSIEKAFNCWEPLKPDSQNSWNESRNKCLDGARSNPKLYVMGNQQLLRENKYQGECLIFIYYILVAQRLNIKQHLCVWR